MILHDLLYDGKSDTASSLGRISGNIDTNRIPYTFSKLNVEDYFSDCAEELGLEMETRGIELVYANYVEKGVQVIADGEQIRRVIHNIVSNAIKYMEKPWGIIQLRVKDVGDFIQVEFGLPLEFLLYPNAVMFLQIHLTVQQNLLACNL